MIHPLARGELIKGGSDRVIKDNGKEDLMDRDVQTNEGYKWEEVEDFDWLKKSASPNFRLVQGRDVGSDEELFDLLNQLT